MTKKLLLFIFLCLTTALFSQKSLQKLATAPNPFYSSTTISFNATSKQPIFLVIKNILGKTVYKKMHTTKIGKNEIFFNRDNLQAGIYIYAIRSRKEIVSKRFIIK
ncbi:MAG: hypothetical protein ACI9SI_001144 [Polaribacter sp.]|jgi:hypothetical protein